MRVVPAEDAAPLAPNTVYLNPADRYVTIQDGRLSVHSRSDADRIRMPIDLLLLSLAEDRQDAAACIILSGSSGADGAKGTLAVHSAGGLSIAQQPQSAQFPAMPQSAIDAGLVDQILPVAEMPAALLAFAARLREATHPADAAPSDASTAEVEAILKLLLLRGPTDYRHYKRATVLRRIQRRMAIRQAATMDSYLAILQAEPAELLRLAQDMLIGVSSFFRDPAVFEQLQRDVLIPLAAAKEPQKGLRAWVPGCATGEEAYTLAILLLEAAASAPHPIRVQVFASDINDHALETARAGVYPASIADDIAPALLSNYFTRHGERYQVTSRLRESVVFSRQDLIADPPFSKLDLISCRNVLIYIQPSMQQKILSLFSFALKRGGCLLLGKSESVGELEGVFEPISKPNRIFRLVRPGRRTIPTFSFHPGGRVAVPAERISPTAPLPLSLIQANQSVLLSHFNASVVLVDAQGRILHFYGETERYLGHPKGFASLNILDMLTGTLSVKLRRAMERVLTDGEPAVIHRAALPHGEPTLVNVTLRRAPASDGDDQLIAIIFEDANGPAERGSSPADSTADAPLVAQLEEEVKALRSELRSEAEEFESANEDLKAANEEVMSMNEELQSANEELEASKEELQSLNEELTSLNGQLSENLGELTSSNNDLANLLSATEIATVFLDSQLRIKRFTPRATELLNVIPADLGRPVSHITQNFDGRLLSSEGERVLRTLVPIEREIQTGDGRWHMMRILPYRTLDDRIDGVVITFADVTRLKQAEAERWELEHRVQHAQKLESLGVLAGGIAHDFNNILTALLGSTDLALLELSAASPAKAHIEEARRCAWRASELTAQMLAYSGRGAFQLRLIDLNAVIREMTPLLEASVSRKVLVDYRLSPTLPRITADPTQMTQVMLNLVMNASEAISDGPGAITVTTGELRITNGVLPPPFADADLRDGPYVLLEVRDTGSGMDPATTARVFEPFFSTKFTGRGLGLSVVAGIVKGHRGAIAVESSPGNGSTFRVILPADGSAKPAPEPTHEALNPAPRGTGTILVIDDEASIRAVVAAFLQRSGYLTLSASSGDGGVALLKTHGAEVRAVLLDATMPGMSTEQILAEIRAIRPGLPVVLCSGFTESEVATRHASNGIAAFIPKPFTMATLTSTIERAIDRQA